MIDNRRTVTPFAEELASVRRLGRHMAIGLGALSVPFVLCGIILANGNYLSSAMSIDSSPMLFRLWPFNGIYLQQFASSSYDGAEIKWFFAVVSCSNLVWLIFLCWKFVFELSRKDVEFPTGNTPLLTKIIVRPLVVCCAVLVAWSLIGLAGFSTHGDSLFFVSFKQPIAIGAFKVVMVTVFAAAAFIFEFGGFGLRYLLAKRFGFFAVGAVRSTRSES